MDWPKLSLPQWTRRAGLRAIADPPAQAPAAPAAKPPAPAASASFTGEADMVRLWSAVRRKWRWVAVPTVLAAVLAAVVVFSLTPRYTGEARILLESRDSYYTRPAADQRDTSATIDAEAVQSQVQVITSRDLARQAIRRLGLVGNSEFDPQAGARGLLSSAAQTIGLSKRSARPPEDRVLDAFAERLLVYAAGRSRVVVIEFRSRDPELAARGANTVAELYLEAQEAAKKDTARDASSWLSGAIDPLRKRVAEAEARVEAFRAKEGLFTGSNNNTLTSQQLNDLSGQLATARATQADSQAKAKLIRDLIRANRAFEIPDVANNESVRRLVDQRGTARSQLALEQRTLLPQHPRIKELNAQLADLDVQIRLAAQRAVKTLEADAQIAAARVERVTAALDMQKEKVADANGSEVQLRALEREAKTQRDQLESYLTRYREAVARDAQNAVPADGRIVSRAVVPLEPSFPKKGATILLATLATFVLCLGGIVAGELLTAPPVQPALAAPLPAAQMPEMLAPSASARVEEVPPAPAASSAPSALGVALAKLPADGRGRRLLLVADWADGRMAVEATVKALKPGRSVVAALPEQWADPSEGPGLTDLLAGDVSFADVIEHGGLAHEIGPGAGSLDEVVDDMESLEVALTALEQSYDALVIEVSLRSADIVVPLLRDRVDAVLLPHARCCGETLAGFPAERIILLDEAAAAGAIAA